MNQTPQLTPSCKLNTPLTLLKHTPLKLHL
jgi:hypothetical protein